MEQKPNVLPLRLEDVSYRYETDARPAVSHVTLEVERGSFVAVLGHNGSGKSTLAKLMNALFLPTEGRVLVCGMDTLTEEKVWNIRRHAGMVFQNPDNQIVANVVREDVAFGLENLGVPQDEMVRRVEAALSAVRMSEFAETAPHMLSGGQKQRVAIAGALAMEPELIIMDEATAMLDPSGRAEVLATVRKLNREKGMTVVWITHFMEEAAVADRLTRILINECYLILRSRKRETLMDDVPERETAPDALPDVYELFTSLEEKYRLPMVLYYVEGYSVAEAAHILHLPQNTLKSRLHRGRQTLRSSLALKEVDG